MVKDEWMRAAMSDDTLVVELLVRLKNSNSTAASPLKSPSPPPPPPSLTWSVRMPRSRALRCDPAAVTHRTTRRGCGGGGDSSARCSPTTPLSWSASAGAASPSGTADGGFEEDSGLSPSLPRSKGRASNHDLATTTTTSRRSRRKKTFSELKEEESLLLKEKVHLKKELTKLRATFREQTTENESLKRMKIHLGMQSTIEPKRNTPSQLRRSTATTVDVQQPLQNQVESKAAAVVNEEHGGGFFLLPDLNSLPCEDDYLSPATTSR